MPTLLKNTVKAWIDKMPVDPHKLIVIGEIEVPTSGWRSDAKAADPQGINKDVIIVEATTIPPSGNVLQVISRVQFRYEESPPKHNYTDATVRYDGQEHTVNVTITH